MLYVEAFEKFFYCHLFDSQWDVSHLTPKMPDNDFSVREFLVRLRYPIQCGGSQAMPLMYHCVVTPHFCLALPVPTLRKTHVVDDVESIIEHIISQTKCQHNARPHEIQILRKDQQKFVSLTGDM